MNDEQRAAALDLIVALRKFEEASHLWDEEKRQVDDMVQTAVKYIK